MNFKVNDYKNKSVKARIILKTTDVLQGIFGSMIFPHVLTDVSKEIYKAIKSDIMPSDLINYHEVVKIIKSFRYDDDYVAGPEMADYNHLIDRIHSRIKELKALSKKADDGIIIKKTEGKK